MPYKDREAKNANARKWNERTRDVRRRYARKWREANREEFNHYARKSTYGITKEEFQERLAQQNNACYLCRREESATFKGKVISLSVDHDHTSGVIRKLLCKKCNTGLGYFRDDPDLLEAAALYIREHRDED